MKVLIADDDPISRRLLEATLHKWGYEIQVACSGDQAWQAFQQEDAPRLGILDWMMPQLDGLELCRRVRALARQEPPYLILLTAKGGKENVVAGLEAGADDYVTKPFDRNELRARLRVAERLLGLQHTLADRVRELEAALARIRQLQGLLPICAYCKKIRDDDNYWQQVETYICRHSDVRFSHGICPECYEKVVKPQLDAMEDLRKPSSRG